MYRQHLAVSDGKQNEHCKQYCGEAEMYARVTVHCMQMTVVQQNALKLYF